MKGFIATNAFLISIGFSILCVAQASDGGEPCFSVESTGNLCGTPAVSNRIIHCTNGTSGPVWVRVAPVINRCKAVITGASGESSCSDNSDFVEEEIILYGCTVQGGYTEFRSQTLTTCPSARISGAQCIGENISPLDSALDELLLMLDEENLD